MGDGLLSERSVRLTVDSACDDALYGVIHGCDDLGMVRVSLKKKDGSPLAQDGFADWSYITDLIEKGSVLNLVRPVMCDRIVYPELIILEPDYLVDISAIAACFETYATTSVVHLINKIQPSERTAAITLGNFAGQLLDEEVSLLASSSGVNPSTTAHHPASTAYKTSARRFFRRNAISLLTTSGIGENFHREARSQRTNIRRALCEGLPSAVEHFDASGVMLEPSFFSEMLGLQGRMDFLTADCRVLLEQKAGKCAFPQPTHAEETPTYQEKHYVQMLLYMALLRYNHGADSVKSFLLYSKYATSLVGLGFNPALLFEALKVRNGIVRNDMLLARGDTGVFDTLSADALNLKQLDGKLWNTYIKPRFDALFEPLHAASPLEKAYFRRLMSFVQQEHILSKLGNGTEENPGFAAKWRDSLAEKLTAGDIYYELTLRPIELNEDGKVEEITVACSEWEGASASELSNFRPGDIVILYPYDEESEPDCRRTPVFRCTITDIGDGALTLRMRTPQSSDAVFRRNAERPWAIEHDFFESSYNALYRGIYAFLSAPRERRDLILLQREPQTDARRTLKGDYGAFNELSLRVKQARDMFLIIGPPGAGKTSFGMLNTLKEELAEPDSSVVLLAYTNRAVDEMCSKLVEEGIDFIRLGSPLSCPEAYRDHMLDAKVSDCDNIAQLKEIVMTARVVVGTAVALNSATEIFALRTFSLAIIDEASQILEPHLLGLLSAHRDGAAVIRKFVMIGDHKQLPAVVQQDCRQSRVDEPLLQDILLTDCRLSLFERLLKRYRHDPRVVYMLTRQGRMHDDIALFPNEHFYAGKLRSVPLPHQVEQLPDSQNTLNALSSPGSPKSPGIFTALTAHRVAFVDVPSPVASPSDKVNEREADVIAEAVYGIYRQCGDDFDETSTVGVIVPYRNQIAAVREAIRRRGVERLTAISIDTVERYQGSQRDYIIYGFTVSKAYQLRFLTNNVFEEDGMTIDRKLNVAMTRARKHLLMVGNAPLLGENPTFAALINFCKERGVYFPKS